jgi:hypothetical protein
MTQQLYRFKCTANPNGPLFITEQFWEAVDMRKHPDYIEVDEHGDLILNPETQAEQRIPFNPPAPTAPRRNILTLPKKAA